MLPRAYEGAVLVQCMLAIEDEDEHARHFWIRDAGSEGLRPMDKYLRALPEIRRIQDYLVERAIRAEVPVIENARIEAAVNDVIQLVLAEVELAHESART
jgi:2-phosphoglycerate kinase